MLLSPSTKSEPNLTRNAGKIQKQQCIPVVPTYIPTVALYIVVGIFAYTSFHYHESYSDFGLELCGETVLKVTGPGPHTISWEDYGFHLIVPHGPVFKDITIDVTVKAFLPRGGKFKLPENFHLVSPIYEVSTSRGFKKNVSVQIQHYANISSNEETADYAFVKGRHSGTNDPYTFEVLDGAFSPHSQLATISLNHSCKLGCVASSIRPTKKYQYAAHAYQRYNPAQPATLELQFFLTPYQRVYEKILDDEYTGWNKSVRSFNIDFKEESITFNINTSTKVEPQTSLKIEKAYIDDLCEGSIETIPSYKVLIDLKEEQGVNLQPMHFNVSLLGAKPPRNFFVVNAPPAPSEYSIGHHMVLIIGSIITSLVKFIITLLVTFIIIFCVIFIIAFLVVFNATLDRSLNKGKWKKNTNDDSDSATSGLGGKWKKKAIDDSDSATSSLGKIQRQKGILMAPTCIMILALCIVVGIFVYTQFHYYENDSYFGLELCGETVLKITGPGPHNISWKDYSFRLIVPHGAVLEDVTVDVTVKAFLPRGGKFKLPENVHLVSAVYEVSSSEDFKKNVSVEIQHYAIIRSDKETTGYGFIKRRRSGINDPYTFEILDGVFSPHSQLATISLNHFCKICAIANSKRARKEYWYAAHAYHRYNPAHLTTLELAVSLTPSLSTYEKRVESKHSGWDKSVEPRVIELQNKFIEFNISPNVKAVWRTLNQIEKKHADGLSEGISDTIPTCEVIVTNHKSWQHFNLQPMLFEVTLLGAIPPENFFKVFAPPPISGNSQGLGEILLWILFVILSVAIPLPITIYRCWQPFSKTCVEVSSLVLATVWSAVAILLFGMDSYITYITYLTTFVFFLEPFIAPAIEQFPIIRAIFNKFNKWTEKKFQ